MTQEVKGEDKGGKRKTPEDNGGKWNAPEHKRGKRNSPEDKRRGSQRIREGGGKRIR